MTEERGLRPIGSLLPKIVNTPKRAAATPTASPSNSATTGTRRRGPAPSNETGPQPGECGSGENPSGEPATDSRNYLRPINSTSALQERLTHGREVSAKLAALMAHYWTPDDHPAVRQAQLGDWLEDLGDYSIDEVAAACKWWRQRYNRRPTPADLLSYITGSRWK